MKTKYYPELFIPKSTQPNKFYAIPLIGLLVKFIMLIPVLILAWAMSVAAGIMAMLFNPFVLLFTGEYSGAAYSIISSLFIYNTKLFFFLSGLTDQYPGFNFNPTGFSLTIPQPQNPNRLWAFPVLGFFVRAILMIPFFIFVGVLKYAALLGVLANFIPVLFTGKYQESFYELVLDYQRVTLAQGIFIFGLSDNYPSFKISWNHKNTKVALMILGAVLLILQIFSSFSQNKTSHQYTPTPNYSSRIY